jgi:hypothetical protein
MAVADAFADHRGCENAFPASAPCSVCNRRRGKDDCSVILQCWQRYFLDTNVADSRQLTPPSMIVVALGKVRERLLLIRLVHADRGCPSMEARSNISSRTTYNT